MTAHPEGVQETCLKVEIGKRLKRLRLQKGSTQKELAAKVRGGLDYTYIGKIERGEQLPSLKILIKISEAKRSPSLSVIFSWVRLCRQLMKFLLPG